MKRTIAAWVGLICWSAAAWAGDAAETKASPARVGVYDSRAVAYAHFWSDGHQQELKARAAAAKAARQAGDTARFGELDAALRTEQEQNHRQVFSTAPVDSQLASLKERLPALQQEAGVTRLVSKWDTDALKACKGAEQVDVTGALVRAFLQPTEKQAKVIAELQKQKPLPLKKCDALIRDGKI